MPFEVTAGRATGPGVFDMKCGMVQGEWALRSLRDGLGEMPPMVCLFTSDEETGSFTSRELIEASAQHAKAVLALEPSQDGLVKPSRKGVGLFRLDRDFRTRRGRTGCGSERNRGAGTSGTRSPGRERG